MLDLARDRVALELEHTKLRHACEDVEHCGVLELVVLKIQDTDAWALGKVLHVCYLAQPVICHLESVEPTQDDASLWNIITEGKLEGL